MRIGSVLWGLTCGNSFTSELLHAFLGCPLLSESIHSFSESIQSDDFVLKFSLNSPFYI